MWRLGIETLAVAGLAFAQTVYLHHRKPGGVHGWPIETGRFVFRTEGCADAAKAHVDGTGEGLVQGARKSVALKLAAMSTPGVYACIRRGRLTAIG